MKIPSAEEYLQIVNKKVPGSLATLYNHRFILEEDGKIPLNKISRNTIVFKTEYHSRFYAVRFFLNDDEEFFRRYRQIQNYLTPKSLSWKVPFRFMDEEYYPAILMDWIDGLSFTEYLDLIIDDPSGVSKLQQELISLSRELERNGIGHGNLNMSHIRFVKQDQDYVLKLIDYDSMFIPSFEEKNSFSAGTAGFQHSMRLASDFSEKIDRFSFWVFLTALEGFKIDPSLWKNAKEIGFDKEEQILFTYRDFAFAEQSATFQTLHSYNSMALNFYCDKLISFCNATSLDQIDSPKLYEEKNADLLNKNQELIYKPQKASGEVFIKEPELSPITSSKKSIVSEETRSIKEQNQKNNGLIPAEQKIPKKENGELQIPVKRNRKKPVAAIIAIAVLVLSAAAYLAWNNQSKKTNTVTAAVSKPSPQIQQPIQKKEQTIFSSVNITQFLFQLYQSYNKRDLSSILSNYADSVSQYYDAGAMQKSKLNDVIKNLFIKPAHYECHPDLTTLQLNAMGDSCKLTISINETIKADKRSKTENYSSKIEYIIDTSFKIVAEKNMD
jgi:hypothetical protein